MKTTITGQASSCEYDAAGLAAMQRYFKKFYHVLYHYAFSITKEKSEAEDIVVESFLKLNQLRANFDSEATIKNYLYAVVRNACLQYLQIRKARRNSHTELSYLNKDMDDADIEAQLNFNFIESEVVNAIVIELKQLPPMMRRIFHLIFVEQLSTEEIARKLDISPATIRVQKARAVNVLKEAMLKKGLKLISLVPLVRSKLIHGIFSDFHSDTYL